MQKTDRLYIRLTEDEKALIKWAAERHGQKMAEFVRLRVVALARDLSLADSGLLSPEQVRTIDGNSTAVIVTSVVSGIVPPIDVLKVDEHR